MEKIKQFFRLEPALIRGLLLAIVAVAAKFGLPDLEGWVDVIVELFIAVSAFIAVLWARPVIAPMAKVLAFKPRPYDNPEVIEPGNAVATTPTQLHAVEDAATRTYDERSAA